jgi:hypothetical protein
LGGAHLKEGDLGLLGEAGGYGADLLGCAGVGGGDAQQTLVGVLVAIGVFEEGEAGRLGQLEGVFGGGGSGFVALLLLLGGLGGLCGSGRQGECAEVLVLALFDLGSG